MGLLKMKAITRDAAYYYPAFAPKQFLRSNNFTKYLSISANSPVSNGNILKLLLKKGNVNNKDFLNYGIENKIYIFPLFDDSKCPDWLKETLPDNSRPMIYKNTSNNTLCLVSIPYAFKNEPSEARSMRSSIYRWAKKYDLKATIHNESWYGEEYCTVIITLPDVSVKWTKGMKGLYYDV